MKRAVSGQARGHHAAQAAVFCPSYRYSESHIMTQSQIFRGFSPDGYAKPDCPRAKAGCACAKTGCACGKAGCAREKADCAYAKWFSQVALRPRPMVFTTGTAWT